MISFRICEVTPSSVQTAEAAGMWTTCTRTPRGFGGGLELTTLCDETCSQHHLTTFILQGRAMVEQGSNPWRRWRIIHRFRGLGEMSIEASKLFYNHGCLLVVCLPVVCCFRYMFLSNLQCIVSPYVSFATRRYAGAPSLTLPEP